MPARFFILLGFTKNVAYASLRKAVGGLPSLDRAAGSANHVSHFVALGATSCARVQMPVTDPQK